MSCSAATVASTDHGRLDKRSSVGESKWPEESASEFAGFMRVGSAACQVKDQEVYSLIVTKTTILQLMTISPCLFSRRKDCDQVESNMPPMCVSRNQLSWVD